MLFILIWIIWKYLYYLNNNYITDIMYTTNNVKYFEYQFWILYTNTEYPETLCTLISTEEALGTGNGINYAGN